MYSVSQLFDDTTLCYQIASTLLGRVPKDILILQLNELEARRVLHLSQLREARLAYLEQGTNQSTS